MLSTDKNMKLALVCYKAEINYVRYTPGKPFNVDLDKHTFNTKALGSSCVWVVKKKKFSRTNVVTLRAPKHFKVGRNHYSVFKKKYKLLFSSKFKNTQIVSDFRNLTGVARTLVGVDAHLPTPALMSATTCKVTISVRFGPICVV